MSAGEEIESPCIRNCAIDQGTGYCMGCFRTLQEISYWVSYTREQRLRILGFIAARRAASEGSPPAN